MGREAGYMLVRPVRLAACGLVAAILIAGSGCSKAAAPKPAPLPSQAPAVPGPVATSTPSQSGSYAHATPPARAGAGALTLPSVAGRPVADPAETAASAAQLLRPGATVVLSPAAIRLLGGSVDGTMVATVVERDQVGRQLIARIERFRVPRSVGIYYPPAILTLPRGTLVRIDLPKPKKGAPTNTTALAAGETVALVVHIGVEPQGPVVRLVAVANGQGVRK